MDKSFCEKIDREALVEEYVRGKLTADLRHQIEQHLGECDRHARAVHWEINLRAGVIDFARNQVRSRIRKDYQPQENLRFTILRYAAVLFVIVTIPLLLYYQFRIFQPQPSELKGTLPPTAISDSSTKTNTQPEKIINVQTPPVTARRKTAPEVQKPESPPVTAESSAGAGENAANMESEIAAPVQADLESKTPPESIEDRAQLPARVADRQSLADTKGHLNMKQSISVDGIGFKVDSSQNLLVYSSRDTVPADINNYIDQQIVIQKPGLVKCLSAQDSLFFINVRLSISARGLVEQLQVIQSNIADKNIENCLVDQIKLWKFKLLRQPTIVIKKIYLKF